MDAVTYPEEKVINAVEKYFIPVRIPHDAKPLARRFGLTWTPLLIMVDAEGVEHHRSVGFLPPEELIPMLLLARGKVHYGRGEQEEAIAMLDLMASEYPKSHWTPEGIYYRAVAQYKQSHEAKPLKAGYERLAEEYPSSLWAQKAAPYRLLNV